ncbi:hypothetical protein [cf. Phormidesmis sp. LEGE 11477]|uniref:hypothetical protein n=1 Tax=cf. Phormidesmis sp. LEGE 11477 TaxID=1828680 RepID=UPI00187EA10F|nr:hypothetical protein [cf. Phormidesmis sp. LEGE 11477]MBE9061035.1 hypothetical protein [cf. Phormidesmis sp. LEGE 11477]
MLENTLVLGEVVGAIAGTIIGIQTVAIQMWFEDSPKSWRSLIRTISAYTLGLAIIFGTLTYTGIISPDPQKPLIEFRDAVLFGLPFPFLIQSLKRTSQ